MESHISYPDSRYPFIAFASTLLFLFIDFSLFRGRNWARLTKIVFASLIVFALFYPNPQLTFASIVLLGFQAALAIAGLVYLTRPAVIAFFKGQPAKIA